MDVRAFKVLYAKSGVKKRKLFADGELRIRQGPPPTFIATLISEDGCEVSKRTEKSGVTYSVGDEIVFGAFVVQIDEEIVGAQPPPPLPAPAESVPPFTQRLPSNSFKIPKFSNPVARAPIAARIQPLATSAASAKNYQSSLLDGATECVTDDSFWDVELQESGSHSIAPPANLMPSTSGGPSSAARVFTQINTTQFRSNLGKSRGAVSKTPIGPVEQDPSLLRAMRPHQVTGADFLISRLSDGGAEEAAVTGAILADEMGVGKTLTSISAMWAFIRRGGCKCLVVCPSSLVDNWLKELRHWLGTRLKPLSLKPGADAAAVINTFAISLPSLYPLMVLSYEMFRKHALLLNTIPHLELMICDEGHRLKNIGGTKTMDALRDCKARRRIILSGTPIQNDLDELYAVVGFVAPGLLGSLSEFKRRMAGPIARGNEEDATPADREAGSEAAGQLRDLLSKVMLRRTQAEILTDLLPPRRDYVIYCALTQSQRVVYTATADSIMRDLGGTASDEDEDDDMFYGEAEEVSGGVVRSSAVLAGLQSLRGTCTTASRATSGGAAGGGKANFLSARSLGSGAASGKENAGPLGGSAGEGGSSAKLQVLMRFLTVLRRVSPEEKVVVVSNFTTALDEIDAAVGSRWGESLRLDGKVPVDQRQALVNRFNKADDPSFLFLLSAKAGGVGINLVGASRLVMFDVDWNPAVDHQAMSRIWREGQRREAHIYRLVTAGTIEEAILQRQRSKNDLAGMVEGDADALAVLQAPADDPPAGWPGLSERRMSLTRSDVLQLIYPNKQAGLGAHGSGSSGSSGSSGVGEEVMDTVVRELGGRVIVHATAVR